MSTDFKDQGGAASSDPSWLRRWITSRVMRHLADPLRRQRARDRAEARRDGAPHRVEYFHQADDPYSHLAAQALAPLQQAYEIELLPRLVSGARGANAPEPVLLRDYARRDAALVAPHYGLEFGPAPESPAADVVARAVAVLAGCAAADFGGIACAVGRALWAGDTAALQRIAQATGSASAAAASDRMTADTARRDRLGHYGGAMFYYAGEWYWGVDRLYHLEQRLIALGAARDAAAPLLFPRPPVAAPRQRDNGALTLEFYVSLRSPYTSIIFDRALALVRDSGVRLELRPVLPMVMRGVALTAQKGRYIAFDTAREAETLGLEWGRVRDPIGEPVRRVYSLLPWARREGRAEALLGAALHAAFFEALDLGSDGGLRCVVEAAGLDWSVAAATLGSDEWQAPCERNREAMYAAGLWGVPAFRLLDATGTERLAVWGQDRLWLVAREIARLLEAPAETRA